MRIEMKHILSTSFKKRLSKESQGFWNNIGSGIGKGMDWVGNQYDQARIGWQLGKANPLERWQQKLRNMQQNEFATDPNTGQPIIDPETGQPVPNAIRNWQNTNNMNPLGRAMNRRISRKHQGSQNTINELISVLERMHPALAQQVNQALENIGYYEPEQNTTQQQTAQPQAAQPTANPGQVVSGPTGQWSG
jgi:hypothetical protein